MSSGWARAALSYRSYTGLPRRKLGKLIEELAQPLAGAAGITAAGPAGAGPAASGMHLDRQRAGELITGQVRAVAALLRVTEATARTYLGDETVKDMARRMLFEVAGERPSAGLMQAPRAVPLPLALVGITVAALAEATSGTSSPQNRRKPAQRDQ